MIADILADFSVMAHATNIPDDPGHVLKLSLLDWCSVALAGCNEPVSKIVRDQGIAEDGKPQSFVFGSKTRLPARAAALINGTTSHALDYDDTHFHHVGHTSVVVLSAALAVAELQDAAGNHFMHAALIGSEAACRLGHWFGSDHYNNGFHQTATAGTFGAALAAAHLLQLDRVRTKHALGIASTKAAGLKCQFGTMGKPYNAGIAAESGVQAALLAGKGFESRLDAIDCEQGFAETHLVNSKRSRDSFDGIGENYVFTDVQHKFHACCHGLHSAIEALISVREMNEVKAEEVSRISIQVNPKWLSVCDKKTPLTGLEAKFSYSFVAAMALCGFSTASLENYTDEMCVQPELVMIRDRVDTVGNDEFSDTEAAIVIELNDGRELKGAHDLADRLSLQEREAKVREKAAVLLGKRRADKLWDVISDLETVKMRDFTRELHSV